LGCNELFLQSEKNVMTSPSGTIDQIISIAANSDIARYHWKDRGPSPKGYITGMAVAFARVYCKWKSGDAFALEMAKANTGDESRDVLAWYHPEFLEIGMDNSAHGAETLRHLFVLMTGLGMRESSGQYCEGRDMAASNTTGETAEAGLFQTSYNARHGHPLLSELFATYAQSTELIDIFKAGVHCAAESLKNYGRGHGKEFQRLTKACPAFAVEFAAVGLRNVRTHWGPINRKEAELRMECDGMLKVVQHAVDHFKLCQLMI
jgi:hypothetical protein